MRDTTLTSPEMHMERVAACFYMKYHVYWENITDPRSFIYFILLLFILFYFILLLLLLLLLFYYYYYYYYYYYFILLIIYFLESQACLRFELHAKTSSGNDSWVIFFFTYKPVTKVGVIFWLGEFETQTKHSGQFVLPRKWTIEKDWRNQWVKKPV